MRERERERESFFPELLYELLLFEKRTAGEKGDRGHAYAWGRVSRRTSAGRESDAELTGEVQAGRCPV